MTLQDWLQPALMAALISVVGYLLNRSIVAVDTKLSSTSDSVDTMRSDMNSMKLEMNGYAKLVEYQEKRISVMEQENHVLQQAVGALDKHIAVMQAVGKVPNVPTT